MTDNRPKAQQGNDIPKEVRTLVSELYRPEDVQLWWDSKNHLLGYREPRWVWQTQPEDVLKILHALLDGAYL